MENQQLDELVRLLEERDENALIPWLIGFEQDNDVLRELNYMISLEKQNESIPEELDKKYMNYFENKINEIKEQLTDENIEYIRLMKKEHKEILYRGFLKTILEKNPDYFEQVISEIVYTSEDGGQEIDFETINLVFEIAPNELIKKKIYNAIEILKINSTALGAMIERLDSELVNEISTQILEIAKDKPEDFRNIWDSIMKKDKIQMIQKNPKMLPFIIKSVVGEKLINMDKFVRVWDLADGETQRKCFKDMVELTKGKRHATAFFWQGIKDDKLQQDYIISMMELYKDDCDILKDIWNESSRTTQSEKLGEIIKFAKDNEEIAKYCWKYTSAKARLIAFKDVGEVLKEKSILRYQVFVKDCLGDVEFDKFDNPIIPEELNSNLFKNADEVHCNNFEKNITAIIQNWDSIKQNIQYRKANNLINDGLEVRTNVEQILNSFFSLIRLKTNSVSAIEFEMTAGSEQVGLDTQYTKSVGTAVQRAYSLAEKMDLVGTTKKFPDFSVKSKEGNVELKVLHPQDKSAILLGYETGCCFRPNGNADNSAKNEESLLQYCTSTPYGGILKCGEMNENGTAFSKVYMGTPILVNGNCMMFHSYETKNAHDVELVNKLLLDAAENAIKLSNGDIKAVMMTDLHGSERVSLKDKYSMRCDYFQPYCENEYEKYQTMYTNLDCATVLLAAQVGDKILKGEELKKWCNETCRKNNTEIWRKIGMRFGAIDKDYKFEDRNITFERKVQNANLVNEFKREYDRLKEERVILALLKKKAEVKNRLARDDLDIVLNEAVLEQVDKELADISGDKRKIYEDLSLKQIEKRLEENKNEISKTYNGDNLILMAKQHGIEDFEKIVTEKAFERAKVETDNMKEEKQETQKQKKLKGMLIGEIKRSGKKELNEIIAKIQTNSLNSADYQVLETTGIDTKEYKAIFSKENNESNFEQRKNDKIKQKVDKYEKEPEFRKKVLSQEIFAEVDKDLIKQQAVNKSKKTILSKLEKQTVNRENIEQDVQEKAVRLDSILTSLKDEETLEAAELEVLKELKEEYGVDVNEVYNEIRKDENGLKLEAQKQLFDKLQASITIGIEKKEEISRLMKGINSNSQNQNNYDEMIFGLNWYVATGENGEIDMYMKEQANDLEKATMGEIVQQMIDKAPNEKEAKIISAKYSRFIPQEISMRSIEASTEIITGPEKAKAVEIIGREIKLQEYQERGNINENDGPNIGI